MPTTDPALADRLAQATLALVDIPSPSWEEQAALEHCAAGSTRQACRTAGPVAATRCSPGTSPAASMVGVRS